MSTSLIQSILEIFIIQTGLLCREYFNVKIIDTVNIGDFHYSDWSIKKYNAVSILLSTSLIQSITQYWRFPSSRLVYYAESILMSTSLIQIILEISIN